MIQTVDKTTKIKQYVLRFIQLQLFLSLVSLPIMLAWGLPLSLLSPLGNLLFGPVISLFLGISSLIFFSQLLGIPNQWLITCLEHLTSWWLTFMHADTPQWLIGLCKPPIMILMAIPLVTFTIMHYYRTRAVWVNCTLLALLLVGTGWYLTCWTNQENTVVQIPCNRGTLTLIRHDKEHIVIDPGFLGQRTNAPAWAQYTLIPALVKTGAAVIDHFIVLQPGIMTFAALERICSCIGIKKVYIPLWEGTMSPYGFKTFFAMKNTFARQGTQLKRLTKNSSTIAVGATTIEIIPLDQQLTSANISFQAMALTMALGTQIDKQKITIYPAKCAKQSIKNVVQHSKK